MISALSKEPSIKEAYDVLNKFNWTEEELEEYEKLVVSAADAEGVLEAAREEGEEKGIKKGLEKGRKEGEKKGKIVVALNLLKQGIDEKTVAKAAGFSSKEIKKLQKDPSSLH